MIRANIGIVALFDGHFFFVLDDRTDCLTHKDRDAVIFCWEKIIWGAVIFIWEINFLIYLGHGIECPSGCTSICLLNQSFDMVYYGCYRTSY